MYYSKFRSPLNFTSKRSLCPPFFSPQGKKMKPMKIMARVEDDLVEQDQKLILSQDQSQLEDHVSQAEDERQHLITMYEQRHGLSRTPTPTPPTPTPPSPEPTMTYKGALLNQNGPNTSPTPVHSPSYKDVLLKNITGQPSYSTHSASPTPSPTPVHSPSQLMAYSNSSISVISVDNSQQTSSPTPAEAQQLQYEALQQENEELKQKSEQQRQQQVRGNKQLLELWRQNKQLKQNNEELKQQHERDNGQLSILLKQNKRLGQQKQQLEEHARVAIMDVLRQKKSWRAKPKSWTAKSKSWRGNMAGNKLSLGPAQTPHLIKKRWSTLCPPQTAQEQ